MPTPPTDVLPVGRIAGPFGVHGELKCDPTSAGRALFVEGAEFLCERAGARQTIVLHSVREHQGRFLVRIEGAGDLNTAQPFIGATLLAERGRIALSEGEYLDRDLVGCELVSNDGTPYGRVERVEHYPSSDMLVVKGRLVPMVRAFLREIDVEHKRIVVDVPKGLLDDEAEEA